MIEAENACTRQGVDVDGKKKLFDSRRDMSSVELGTFAEKVLDPTAHKSLTPRVISSTPSLPPPAIVYPHPTFLLFFHRLEFLWLVRLFFTISLRISILASFASIALLFSYLFHLYLFLIASYHVSKLIYLRRAFVYF